MQPCSSAFWKRKFDIDISSEIWLLPSQVTKETRLRLLQWKIIHNIYPTNIMLAKMKVKETNKCSECNDTVDVIEHFFFECPKVLVFWSYIEAFVRNHFGVFLTCDVKIVLFGCLINYGEPTLAINHILLLAKMCISIHKKTNSPRLLSDIFEEQLRYRKQLHNMCI